MKQHPAFWKFYFDINVYNVSLSTLNYVLKDGALHQIESKAGLMKYGYLRKVS